MDLTALKAAIPGLSDKSHNDLIKIFGWHLHVHKNCASFTGADIGRCYNTLHLPGPASFGAYFKSLVRKKEILGTGKGGNYKLAHKVREQLEGSYGVPASTVKVNSLLTDLATTIPDMAERAYYKEALLCYRHGALRAAVVMTWNITFAHLCSHVLTKRLDEFNARWQVSMPNVHKTKVKIIAVMDDFNDHLKESEVLTICRDANIITKNIYNAMHAALGKRNAAAHPNAVVIDQLQADAYIADLIVNVVQQIA